MFMYFPRLTCALVSLVIYVNTLNQSYEIVNKLTLIIVDTLYAILCSLWSFYTIFNTNSFLKTQIS